MAQNCARALVKSVPPGGLVVEVLTSALAPIGTPVARESPAT